MPQPTTHHIGARTAYIALGGNVTSPHGTPTNTLREAIKRLPADSLTIVAKSRYFATPAFPTGSGPDFVNAVIAVETIMPPDALLAHLHEIERQLGRDRRQRWSARTLDLDLIAYGDVIHPDTDTFAKWRDLSLEEQQQLAPDGLILPHPRIQDRSFVLGPLCDVAPDWVHPVLGQSAAQLFDARPAKERAELKPLPEGD